MKELPKVYEPQSVEKKIYELWEKGGYFRGEIDKYNQIIAANGGEVTEVNEWGMRKRAYAIDYITEGYYVLVNFKAESALPKEIERNMKNDEKILRYMVVRKEA